jgi:hypothetical protein
MFISALRSLCPISFSALAARTAGGLAIALTGACAHVAPYERGTLAHPTMTPDDTATALEQHVRAISEGAAGGVGGGGGGCGCN